MSVTGTKESFVVDFTLLAQAKTAQAKRFRLLLGLFRCVKLWCLLNCVLSQSVNYILRWLVVPINRCIVLVRCCAVL